MKNYAQTMREIASGCKDRQHAKHLYLGIKDLIKEAASSGRFELDIESVILKGFCPLTVGDEMSTLIIGDGFAINKRSTIISVVNRVFISIEW